MALLAHRESMALRRAGNGTPAWRRPERSLAMVRPEWIRGSRPSTARIDPSRRIRPDPTASTTMRASVANTQCCTRASARTFGWAAETPNQSRNFAFESLLG